MNHTLPLYRFWAVCLLLWMALAGAAMAQPGVHGAPGAQKKWKILHVMSYHAPWEWTDEQLRGFQEALKDLDIDYKIFQMDTKNKSTLAWKEEAGQQARELIEAWQPDLVYTNDDNAQEYVAKYYVNSNIPFVFSGVNADPKTYGFTGSRNITGVLEQEHFVQTMHLLLEIAPQVKKIAVVLDKDPTWNGVVARMKQHASELPGIEFVSWDVIGTFEEYKQKIAAYQTQVDAIASLGIFTFKDAEGKNVPYPEVLQWTAEHSMLPDFSFWESRLGPGTLCAVTVSGYEQGLAAGKIARGILMEGRSPSSYSMEPTVKGEPLVSLARARKLGIPVKTGVLLSAKIFEKFDWDKVKP